MTPEEEADRHRRHGANLFKLSKMMGFTDDDGEGPLEYLMRITYQTGWDDARKDPRD